MKYWNFFEEHILPVILIVILIHLIFWTMKHGAKMVAKGWVEGKAEGEIGATRVYVLRFVNAKNTHHNKMIHTGSLRSAVQAAVDHRDFMNEEDDIKGWAIDEVTRIK